MASVQSVKRRQSVLMLPIYATACFSLSVTLMKGIAVPLWCIALGMPPAMMGVVMSARSILPLFLSIHGGALMDRLGVRRTLLVLTIINVALPWLYPAFPLIIAVVILELVGGLTVSMAWIGAQTALARVAQGDPRAAGRFSFATNLGNLLGPLLVGIAWELGGPVAGFGSISAWGLLLLLSVLFLPVGERDKPPLTSWKELLPDWNSYVQAFRMLKQPGVDMVVFMTFVRIAAYSVQGSFYAVALVHLGQNEANIGVLMGIAGLSSGAATLLSGITAKMVGSQKAVLVGGIGMAVVFICITPALGSFPMLFIGALLFGLGMGISLPLLLSVLSSAIPREHQGISVGLRSTANRLAGVIIPIGLGLVIDMLGIEYGFYVVGALLLATLGIGYFLLSRRALQVSH